ncbi:hypothetical protein, partial [Burkholderia ubonensis]|uniref:hypothetical protein n=1 Tax=Burkholderia ubonensis TaxID=101571 RepID=UPI0018DED3F7
MPNRFSKKKWAERPSSYRWSHLSRTSNPYAQRLCDYSDFRRKRQAPAGKTGSSNRFRRRDAAGCAAIRNSAAARAIPLRTLTTARAAAVACAFRAIAVRIAIAAALAGAAATLVAACAIRRAVAVDVAPAARTLATTV